MADIAENLTKFLLADTTGVAAKVGTRIVQDVLAEAKPMPFVWFSRSSTTHERCLGESGLTPFSHVFAVECVSDDINESQALADLVRARCETLANGGTFGDQTVSNVFAEEQADDYIEQNANPNAGEFVAALQVEVYP